MVSVSRKRRSSRRNKRATMHVEQHIGVGIVCDVGLDFAVWNSESFRINGSVRLG